MVLWAVPLKDRMYIFVVILNVICIPKFSTDNFHHDSLQCNQIYWKSASQLSVRPLIRMKFLVPRLYSTLHPVNNAGLLSPPLVSLLSESDASSVSCRCCLSLVYIEAIFPITSKSTGKCHIQSSLKWIEVHWQRSLYIQYILASVNINYATPSGWRKGQVSIYGRMCILIYFLRSLFSRAPTNIIFDEDELGKVKMRLQSLYCRSQQCIVVQCKGPSDPGTQFWRCPLLCAQYTLCLVQHNVNSIQTNHTWPPRGISYKLTPTAALALFSVEE